MKTRKHPSRRSVHRRKRGKTRKTIARPVIVSAIPRLVQPPELMQLLAEVRAEGLQLISTFHAIDAELMSHWSAMRRRVERMRALLTR